MKDKEANNEKKDIKKIQPQNDLMSSEEIENIDPLEQENNAHKKKFKEEQNEKEQLGLTLSDAVTNSEMILSFASESGIDVEPETILNIVQAKKMEKNNQWTNEGETNFWISYKTVAQLIKPVSIDSIKASEESKIKRPNWLDNLLKKKRKKSIVHNAVLRYSSLALFFMIALLLLQIYSLIGSRLLITIEDGNINMKEGEHRLSELILITENNNENRSAILEKSNIEISLQETTKEVNSSIELLLSWMRIADFLFIDETRKMEEDIEPVMLEVDADIDFDAMSQEFTIDKNIMVIQEAKSLIQILSLYILPLLYGLLGGFVFVLRSIANETRHVTFTKASNLKYGLRIHLGALAGLAVGLFWGDIEKQNINFVESLSTALVAFLAGYSIEFVFRLVDKLVFSIGANKEQKEDKKNNKEEKATIPTKG